MKRTSYVVIFAVALVVALAPTGSVHAGGWAVTTLDPMPALAPGEPAAIGFTIRQHGVTPVELTGVRVVVYPEGAAAATFAARSDGPVGHYIARVTVPEGTHRWEVVQGPFGPQDLGPLLVGAVTAPAERGTGPRWPELARYGLLGLAGVSAIVFVAALAGRARRPSAAA